MNREKRTTGMINSLNERINSIFREVQVVSMEKERLEVTAGQGEVLAVLSFLKNAGFNHLAMISCVDRIDRELFELVYILSGYTGDSAEEPGGAETLTVILKTMVSRQDPVTLSVIPVFDIAEPYEREIHELFGIDFEGHPRLIPLFLERDYEIPPFRKDFDTRLYVKNTFDNVPEVEKKA